ncbi:MAG: VanZ family protein [Phycisphaerae bacterium]|jgi:VanZ family protein
MTVKTASNIALTLAVLYTILLLYLTHASMVDLKKNYGGIIDFFGDKLLHIIAYTGLSTLYCVYSRFRFYENRKSLTITAALLGLFTVGDELSQAFVERSVDPLDLMCNFAGISLGMLLSAVLITASLKFSLVKSDCDKA